MRQIASVFAAVVLLAGQPAGAAEICGNAVDEDADGAVDSGCYPTGVTGVCESPLSCDVAGAISPKLGALVYHVRPDLSFRTAYGLSSITFQRFYTSQYAPGYFPGGVSDHQDTLGYRWQHNYASWITDLGGTPPKVILHMVTGQDVLFTYSSSDATYDYFTPQAGYDFKHLRKLIASPNTWDLQLLTGESYTYDGTSLKLTGLRDSLASPNTVAVTYNAAGKIDRVTDASGYRYFQFEYFTTGKNLLRYVILYENSSQSPTLHARAGFFYDASDNLTTAQLWTTTVESYAYTGNYLTSVTDGDSKTIATFGYSTATAGKAVRVHTGEGDVGYTYADSTCDSGNGTFVLFNRANATSCDVDGDCGTGNYCGGKTTTGATGWCFRAKRCMSLTSAEDLPNVITASGSCASCVGVEDYDWDATTLDLLGTKSADNVWTSYLYDTNGMPTTKVENDTNGDASTVPAGARVTYLIYGNTSFPGHVTESRILSELKPGGVCTAANATDCKRTISTFTTDGKLDTLQEKGFTYRNDGSVLAFTYTSDWNYDTKGRVTAFLGPRQVADDVEYTYWAAGNLLATDYVKEVKRKKDATTYLVTAYAEYDFWGHGKQVKDPNLKLTCRTYHGNYGVMTASRILVGANQTNCSSTNTTDETTSYNYDTHRRVTKVTRPRGNCDAYVYDSDGRRSSQTQADYDTGTSTCATTGDKIEHTYDLDGLRTKTEWKDSASVVRRRQEWVYRADRRVDNVTNPVSATYSRKWLYDDDGVPSELQWEDYSTSDARTQWDVDNLNRSTAIRRYTTSTANEAFTVTPAVQLDLPTKIRDPLVHDLDLVWDDLGRKVKQVMPESGTSFYLYDEAGNLTEMVMAYLSADAKTTTYTYDNAGRKLTENTGDAACFTLGGAELQYTYDALPAGVSCPSGSTCSQLAGRLAHVKVKIYCDDRQADDMFDQATFYSYMEAGRVTQHTVKDDGTRTGRTAYTYDKNGNATRIDYPSGSTTGAVYVFGDATNAANDDKVTTVSRDTTQALYGVLWYPFGQVKEYTQKNSITTGEGTKDIAVTFTTNLAYRLTQIYAKTLHATPTNVFKIDHAEDVRGRYTKRDFSYGSASQQDMFFLYDDLSRTTCRSTTLQSTCPVSGGAGQMETLTYNTSSDRSTFVFKNNLLAVQTYTYNYPTNPVSDKISNITKSGGGQIDFTWDLRGNRLSDDDTSYTGTSNDLRTYTYDARNNLITVAGKFYFSSSTLHDYVVTYAYDERNRLIFKSFKDTTPNPDVEAQWFFYHDQLDRVIEAKYTPNIASSGTYSVFQWYWLGGKPFLYYQIDFPAATTTRRYLHGDKEGRPHAAWSWPTTGSAARVWEVEAGLFGWDVPVVGATIYQPLRFPAQTYDADTEAVTLNGAAKKTLRSGLSVSARGQWDPFSGVYLQPIGTEVPSQMEAVIPRVKTPACSTCMCTDFYKLWFACAPDGIVCVVNATDEVWVYHGGLSDLATFQENWGAEATCFVNYAYDHSSGGTSDAYVFQGQGTDQDLGYVGWDHWIYQGNYCGDGPCTRCQSRSTSSPLPGEVACSDEDELEVCPGAVPAHPPDGAEIPWWCFYNTDLDTVIEQVGTDAYN